MWYLIEELATLGLFDSNVTDENIIRVCETNNHVEESSYRREAIRKQHVNIFYEDLSEFVSKKSLKAFENFDLPCLRQFVVVQK